MIHCAAYSGRSVRNVITLGIFLGRAQFATTGYPVKVARVGIGAKELIADHRSVTSKEKLVLMFCDFTRCRVDCGGR